MKNEDIMRRWLHEVWEQRDLSAVDRWITEESVCHGLADDAETIVGRQAFRHFAESFLFSFSQVSIGIEDLIADGDRVCVRCLVQVTQEGTGRRAEFRGVFWATFRDQRIMEGWNYFDFATMLRQLEAAQPVSGGV
jgi:predicted ester cyclase